MRFTLILFCFIILITALGCGTVGVNKEVKPIVSLTAPDDYEQVIYFGLTYDF